MAARTLDAAYTVSLTCLAACLLSEGFTQRKSGTSMHMPIHSKTLLSIAEDGTLMFLLSAVLWPERPAQAQAQPQAYAYATTRKDLTMRSRMTFHSMRLAAAKPMCQANGRSCR
jgi:hypothetical protein